METSNEINEIAAALAKAQAVMAKAAKDSDNPFFNSKYADLSSVVGACRESLTANNIAVVQGASTTDNGAVVMTTRLIHSSGQWIETSLACRPAKPDAQSMGSVITYLRRYALASMAGVVADDDDGNAASGMTPEAPGKTAGKPPKAPARPTAPANGAARASDAPTAGKGPVDWEQGDELPPELGDPQVKLVGPNGEAKSVRLTKALEWIKGKHADATIEHDTYWQDYYQPNVTWLERHAPKVASELAVRGG